MVAATSVLFCIISAISCSFIGIFANDIAILDVSAEDLSSKINSNQFVLTLFYEDDCKKCTHVKKELARVAENSMIKDLLIATINDADKAAEYNIKSFPALIFFRQGNPILYDVDLIEGHDVEVWMEQFRNSVLRKLTDDSFEHDTQMATGATTGDWFVMFYSESCQQLMAGWDAVAARLHHRIVVATVDVRNNPKLQARFSVTECPTIIFFRHGNMYRYELQKYDVGSLVAFAQNWYQNMKAMKVPPEPSPFDLLTDSIAIYLKEKIQGPYGNILVGGSFVAVLALFVLLVVLLGNTKREKVE